MNDPKLSLADIVEELQGQAKQLHDSYRETDGVVRDPTVLRSIAALREAAKIVKNNRAKQLRGNVI